MTALVDIAVDENNIGAIKKCKYVARNLFASFFVTVLHIGFELLAITIAISVVISHY